ncbi:MAG: fatty acid desaturase [Planctomycetota bacterium]
MRDLTAMMELPSAAGATPTLREARTLLDPDLFRPRPWLYWADLGLSAAIGWSALVAAALRARPDAETAVLVVVAAFAFLRAVLFIHEISHFKKGAMPGFEAAWNLVVGVPMLVPSVSYASHLDHHRKLLYGTIRDPEYLPLGLMGRGRIFGFVLETLLVPLLLVVRFGVIGPLSLLVPPLRAVVEERLSSLVINPSYRRPRPRGRERAIWWGLEILMLVWIAAVAAAVATGRLSWRALVVWYAVAALVAFVNQIRTLAAHHYRNPGAPVDTGTQLLDSINVRGMPFLTELVFPVGLKYHALHHFVPDMPYHGLAAAHARLMEALPADSRYRETEEAGGWAAIARLWRDAAGGRGAPETWREGAEVLMPREERRR